MYYRTRVYIAGDWDNDKNVVDQLYAWNSSNNYGLNFSNAHDLTQARDDSLYCSIKKSLYERLSGSKTFVLIVGEHTKNLTKGNCYHCPNYRYYADCTHGNQVNMHSYVDFECNYAKKNNLKVVVIYNSSEVNRDKCPVALRDVGKHIPFYVVEGMLLNYGEIFMAIQGWCN